MIECADCFRDPIGSCTLCGLAFCDLHGDEPSGMIPQRHPWCVLDSDPLDDRHRWLADWYCDVNAQLRSEADRLFAQVREAAFGQVPHPAKSFVETLWEARCPTDPEPWRNLGEVFVEHRPTGGQLSKGGHGGIAFDPNGRHCVVRLTLTEDRAIDENIVLCGWADQLRTDLPGLRPKLAYLYGMTNLAHRAGVRDDFRPDLDHGILRGTPWQLPRT